MSNADSQRPEVKFDWFIPIDGDGEHIGTMRAERPPTFDYLREVVSTAEAEGYYSQLIPTRFANGLFDQEAPLAETWTTATALAAVTSDIRFLIAVRPGFIAPGLFAQMAGTLDNITGGRDRHQRGPGRHTGRLRTTGGRDRSRATLRAGRRIRRVMQTAVGSGRTDYIRRGSGETQRRDGLAGPERGRAAVVHGGSVARSPRPWQASSATYC